MSSTPREVESSGEDDFLSAYDYELPAECIAAVPAARREEARLLVHHRTRGGSVNSRFRDLSSHLRPGDLLVLNDTRVLAARLHATRGSGGRVELLVQPDPTGGEGALALLRPSARVRGGEELHLPGGQVLRVVDPPGPELRRISFEGSLDALCAGGELPLPPYLPRNGSTDHQALDRERYQTVYAERPGAIAAPTAGLHFTHALLQGLREQGIAQASLTLHVGAGTFLPVRRERLSEHSMHAEAYEIPPATAAALQATRAAGGRVIAVGTTTTRALESAATPEGGVVAGRGVSRLLIRPPYEFRVVDGMITNFHLPRSTLLALVAAFAGRRRILELYHEAREAGYRFYSYGDATLLLD